MLIIELAVFDRHCKEHSILSLVELCKLSQIQGPIHEQGYLRISIIQRCIVQQWQ